MPTKLILGYTTGRDQGRVFFSPYNGGPGYDPGKLKKNIFVDLCILKRFLRQMSLALHQTELVEEL